ncbi:MAG: DUF1624 domain-containing protein [Planctomycetes bacterium]|nr:DUF1624 domain-containing protein [Planctomycetota bacterium]
MTDAPPRAARIPAIDRMRGLVMVLMASDHASHAYYADGLMRDTAFVPDWSLPLPPVPFLHRWLSHLCAPTFVFLAGASIALAAARCTDRAASRAFDRDLLLRGLLLIAIELTFISAVWGPGFQTRFVAQVLWALGSGMVAMVALRHLPPWLTLALGLVIATCHELPFAFATPADGSVSLSPGFVTAWLFSGGFGESYAVAYPTLPWLAPMLIGHAFGSHLARGGSALRIAITGAVLGLGTWVAVKLGDGYGNLLMRGVHDSWLRWLQCSKYPPSLAFLGLELGLCCAILVLLFVMDRRRREPLDEHGPLLVLGQTALFFYLLHIAILEGSGAALTAWLGRDAVAGGLTRTWIAVIATIALLWPAGIWFRSLRRRHPRSLLRLI